MQRWAVILFAYNFDVVYKKSNENANSDCLSRLPVETRDDYDFCMEREEVFSVLNELPIKDTDISEATRKDTILSRVIEYTLNGWPNTVTEPNLIPFFRRKDEISVENGVILWGLRVVIPKKFQTRMLEELHDQHIGVCKMKALARGYMYWPNIDKDIEQMTKACSTCASVRNLMPTAPLYPWKWASRPWQRIHVDFAEFKGQMFFLVIDNYSKWLEVVPMKSTTSAKTIETLRRIFSTWGLPEELVSDNGPQFTSYEFKEFMQNNGVKHTLIPPYHASSNGQVERMVQELKKTLRKNVFDAKYKRQTKTLNHAIASFLLKYRNTPNTTTGESPAVMFLKRQLRTRISLIRPNKTVVKKQDSMKQNDDKSAGKDRKFQVGDKCLVKTTFNTWRF